MGMDRRGSHDGKLVHVDSLKRLKINGYSKTVALFIRRENRKFFTPGFISIF